MERLFDVAVQVPGMAIIGGVFLYTLTKLMDFFGHKLDRAIDAMEAAVRRFDDRA